jgi:hypothetical protein
MDLQDDSSRWERGSCSRSVRRVIRSGRLARFAISENAPFFRGAVRGSLPILSRHCEWFFRLARDSFRTGRCFSLRQYIAVHQGAVCVSRTGDQLERKELALGCQ